MRRPAGRAAARNRRPGSRFRPRAPSRRGRCPSALAPRAVDGDRDELGALIAARRHLGTGGGARRSAQDPSIDDSPPNGQPPCVDVRLELVAELAQVALRPARRRSRRARRATCRGSGRRRREQVEVARARRDRPRSSRGAARASASPRGTACTSRTTRACRTSPPRSASCTMQQRSSITITAAEPKNEPAARDRVVVHRRVELVGRQDRHATSRRG